VRRVFDAHPGPKRLWIAPGAPHAGASGSPGYWPVVLGFVDDNGPDDLSAGSTPPR